jgi:hypothetical protein
LRFVCKRFVVPVGKSLPKQLSPEVMKMGEGFVDLC